MSKFEIETKFSIDEEVAILKKAEEEGRVVVGCISSLITTKRRGDVPPTIKYTLSENNLEYNECELAKVTDAQKVAVDHHRKIIKLIEEGKYRFSLTK